MLQVWGWSSWREDKRVVILKFVPLEDRGIRMWTQTQIAMKKIHFSPSSFANAFTYAIFTVFPIIMFSAILGD